MLYSKSKNTQWENMSSNKTEVLIKGINMDIWVAGTLNQLIIEVYYAQINFSKTVLWDRFIFNWKNRSFFIYKKNYFSKNLLQS